MKTSKKKKKQQKNKEKICKKLQRTHRLYGVDKHPSLNEKKTTSLGFKNIYIYENIYLIYIKYNKII